MNILFVYSLFKLSRRGKMLQAFDLAQLGISCLSSYLRKHGHRTELLVLNRMLERRNERLLEETVLRFDPRVVAFTAVSTEYEFVRATAAYLRKRFPQLYLVIGGAHVSLNPEGVLDPFDALCVGEGEEPLLELVKQLEEGREPSGIRNLWVRRGTEIERNPPRPFRENLDELPFPDRELWQPWVGEDPVTRYSLLLGRGCPFECTYCSNHALKRLAPGMYTRRRSVENIVEEIAALAQRHPTLRELYLEIETIAVHKDWTLELCRRLRELNASLPRPLSYGTNLRITPKQDLAPLFRAFREANFRFVNIGLESGSRRVRSEVLKREYDNEDVVRAVALAREHGLKVAFFNLMGIPGETPEDFRQTVEINRRCQPDWTWNSIFYPYPGTKLHALCREQGLIRPDSTPDMERRISVLNLPGFPKRSIEHGYVWFEYLVYKGHRPFPALLAGALRKQLGIYLFAARSFLNKMRP